MNKTTEEWQITIDENIRTYRFIAGGVICLLLLDVLFVMANIFGDLSINLIGIFIGHTLAFFMIGYTFWNKLERDFRNLWKLRCGTAIYVGYGHSDVSDWIKESIGPDRMYVAYQTHADTVFVFRRPGDAAIVRLMLE